MFPLKSLMPPSKKGDGGIRQWANSFSRDALLTIACNHLQWVAIVVMLSLQPLSKLNIGAGSMDKGS